MKITIEHGDGEIQVLENIGAFACGYINTGAEDDVSGGIYGSLNAMRRYRISLLFEQRLLPMLNEDGQVDLVKTLVANNFVTEEADE